MRTFFIFICTVLMFFLHGLPVQAAEAIPQAQDPDAALEEIWDGVELDESQRAVVEMYDAIPGQLATIPLSGTADRLQTTEQGLRYLEEDGSYAVNTWVEIDGDIYFFGDNELAVRGLQIVNDHTYFFYDDYTCAFGHIMMGDSPFFFTPAIGMNHGWVSQEGEDDVYYYGEDGVMYTDGWLTLDKHQYYFDPDGRLHRGWLFEEDGHTYYFDGSGQMVEGWHEIEGIWFYFSESNSILPEVVPGALAYNEWHNFGEDGERFVNDEGMMTRDARILYGSFYYDFDDEGHARRDMLSGFYLNWAYLLAFGLTTMLVYLGGVLERNGKNKKAALLPDIAAIVILTVLATVRHFEVGIDVNVYVTPVFNNIVKNGWNLREFYEQSSIVTEPTFMLASYIGAKLFHTPRFMMGLFSFLTTSFIYAGIRNQNDLRYRWFAWLAYCLVFYNSTLNVMRQFVGIAILFYLFSEREPVKPRKAIPLILLATAFHYSSIVGILLYIAHTVLTSNRMPQMMKYCVFGVAAMVPLLTPRVVGESVQFLLDREIIDRYDGFVYGGARNRGTYTNVPDVVLITVSVILLAVFVYYEWRMTQKRSNRLCRDSFGISAVDLLYANNFNKLNYRFQFFISIFRLQYMTAFLRTNVPKKWKRLGMAVMIVFMIIFWYQTYVLDFTAVETTPYLFWWQDNAIRYLNIS